MEMHQQRVIATNRRHFLIICFPVQGHINPTLQLAKTLAHGGAKVTFTTTGHGLQRVHETLPSLEGLSYVSFYDGLDPGSADGFSSFMADLMKAGSENLLKLLEKFEEMDQKVDCLVYSFLLPWAARVARAVKVPSAFLSVQCATAFSIYHRFFNGHDGIYNVNGGKYDLETCVSVKIPQLPLFSATDLPTFLLPDDPLNTFMIPLMQEHIQELENDAEPCVFVNTFEELEEDAIRTFEGKMNVIAVGPLIPSAFTRGDENASTDRSYGADLFHKNGDYFQWLDDKDEHSVIYISFGSIVVLKKEQKEEIMQGLREIKRPFLWVIRSTDIETQEHIQKSLEHEVKHGDGLIVPWCSQMEVLTHKSIGCFVTHCGWNSTLESLLSGVPVIGCPHFSDQTTNAKMVEEVWGTGVRARVNGDVVIGRDEFKRCLEMVMGDGERGREIKYHCKKWRVFAMEAVKEGGSTNKNLKCVLDGKSHHKV